MFVSINPVKKLQRDLADEIDAHEPAPPAARPTTIVSALLRGIGPSIDAVPASAPLPIGFMTTGSPPAGFPPPQSSAVAPQSASRHEEWSSLIDRIRASARHMRDVEAEARTRDGQMEDLVRRVTADMAEAEARVREAEARLAEVEARAVDQVRAAEARAVMAERRARESEEWLARVQEIIQAEFAGTTGTDR